MALSCKDPHFLLKFITLILLLITIFVTLQSTGTWNYNHIVGALTNTSTIVIAVLIISIVFIESPKTTEICLLVSVIVMLIICCLLWVPTAHKTYVKDNEGYYVVFTDEKDRRNVYLGLTIPAIILEIIDVVFHAMNK